MCKQCETKLVYEFTNQRKLCANCFVRWFQKKVLYSIRKFEMIKSGDIVGYVSGNEFRDVVLEDVLKMFAEKGNVEIRKISKNDKKITKIAIPDTTDLIANEIVHEVVEGKVSAYLPILKKVSLTIIRPLYLFLDKEVELYAKLRKLQFVKKKEEKDKLSEFVGELEKKHPEIKHAVLKGMLRMN